MSCVAGLSQMTVRGKCRKQCADIVGGHISRQGTLAQSIHGPGLGYMGYMGTSADT